MSLVEPIVAEFLKAAKGTQAEVEVGFPQLSMQQYQNVLSYVYAAAEGTSNVQTLNTLDVNVSVKADKSSLTNYRITVDGMDNIKRIIGMFGSTPAHIVVGKLANMILAGEPGITAMLKVKDRARITDIPEYDLRVRSADEKKIAGSEVEKLQDLAVPSAPIEIRMKERVSALLDDGVRIDVTYVKQGKLLTALNTIRYELEVEADGSKKTTQTANMMETITTGLLKFLQGSSVLVPNSQKNAVIESMTTKCQGETQDANVKFADLPAMQVATAGIPELLDTIPGKYCLTDKADGEHYFLMIHDGKLYGISNNLHVKNCTVTTSSKDLAKYNDTILDGEYIFLEEHNKFMFLAFDILFYKGEDMRKVADFSARLGKMQDVIRTLFDPAYEAAPASKSTSGLVDFYTEGMIKHLERLNNLIHTAKAANIVSGKMFVFPVGTHMGEIYAYSTVMWKLYRLGDEKKKKTIKAPYELDGLIYTPLNQIYTRSLKETRYKLYKWKPANMNSIDLYVEYERNKVDGQPITAFDGTLNGETMDDFMDEVGKDEAVHFDISRKSVMGDYTIMNLMVGHSNSDGTEVPVPFARNIEAISNAGLFQAYIPLDQDGHARDMFGDIIEDKTVVEFAYNLKGPPMSRHNWIPMRTRYDKTDMVRRMKRKYGNNEFIAISNWMSIQQNVTIDDLRILGDIKTTDAHVIALKKRYLQVKEDNEKKKRIRLQEEGDGDKDKGYYALNTDIGEGMRQFHNYIKSNLIYTLCGPKMLRGRATSKQAEMKKLRMDKKYTSDALYKVDVLDVGVGQGGDLLKFFHAGVNRVVGFDPDHSNLYKMGGAISRYEDARKRYPTFVPMTFVVADAGAKLDAESQGVANSMMASKDVADLVPIFGKTSESKEFQTFDIANCQFMVHYLFKDETILGNYLYNLNKYLRPTSYVIITTFDGDRLFEALQKNGGEISASITDSDGKSIELYRIVRKYPAEAKRVDQLGMAVDVYNSIYTEEGRFYTEYLVSPKMLIDKMAMIGFHPVDVGSFEMFYNMQKPFFDDVAPYDLPEARKYLMRVKAFMDLSKDEDKKWFEYSKLNNYYVFSR